MKFVYVSVSLTGADKKKNGLFEIGMVVEVNEKTVGGLNLRFIPSTEVDDKFVSAAYPNREIPHSSDTPAPLTEEEAMKRVETLLSLHINTFDTTDRYFFVGYNSPYSYDFFKEFFQRNSQRFFGFFWSNPVDLMSICTDITKEHRASFTDIKLTTMAKFFNSITVIDTLDYKGIKRGSVLWEAVTIKNLYSKLGFEHLDETLKRLNPSG